MIATSSPSRHPSYCAFMIICVHDGIRVIICHHPTFNPVCPYKNIGVVILLPFQFVHFP